MAVATAADLLPVSDVSARLQALLERAGELKQNTSIDPPLPQSELTNEVDALQDDINSNYDQQYRWTVVETAARRTFYSLLNSLAIDDPAFVQVWNLLDILVLAGDRGVCESALPCHLLEELLDSQTTDGCRKVFDYLESRRERLAQKDFHKKNLVFLRSCNELLRRLSRAEDAVFCGRVFFFLFQTFPLGDKSSVNLRGDFHTENTTKFEVAADPKSQNGDHMEVDEVATVADQTSSKAGTPSATPQPSSKPDPSTTTKAKDSSKKATDDEVLDNSSLYPIFWRLQQDFCEPTRLFNADNFHNFKKGLRSTIAKFKKTPPVVSMRAVEEERALVGEAGHARGIDNYNPKYLTSRDLFDLELSDLAFQRHILLQGLILIDFLLSLTEKAKKKLVGLQGTNRSLLYDYTLSEDDTKWASSMRAVVTKYLNDCDKEGRFYCRMVETVLARDKNWVRWKIESCPSIVRDPVSTEEELEARKGAREATHQRRMPAKPVGAMDLSFLDEAPLSGLEQLKDPARFAVPSIRQLVDGMKTDELDKDMAMDDGEIAAFDSALANKRWRALRLATNTQLDLLNKVDPNKDLDDLIKPPKTSGDEDESGVKVETQIPSTNGEVPAVTVIEESSEAVENLEGASSTPVAAA